MSDSDKFNNPGGNDAFAVSADMLTAAEALTTLLRAVAPVKERETVGLTLALGRVLAEDIVSPRAVPPHDNAAVDGYAVYADDLDPASQVLLPVTGLITAGRPLTSPALRGEALRIFTGAPVPPGPDTILPQEICEEAHGHVTVPPQKRGANLRRAGEDIQTGAVVLRRGTRLRPQELGLAASIGVGEVSVFRPVRVALFSTGDEVREPGCSAGAGAIYDSNRFILHGLLRGLGCAITDFGIVPDRLGAVTDTLARAGYGHDLVLTSGGVSAGDEDHVRTAAAALGALEFWRIAIRPGRPLAFGRVGDAMFLGLPGNPVACMITFLIFARPLLLALAGATVTPPQTYRVIAGFSAKKRQGRREYLRASLHRTADGSVIANRFPQEGSWILTSMTASCGLIDLPESLGGVAPGDWVEFLQFSDVLG